MKRTRSTRPKASSVAGGSRGYPRPQLQRADWTSLNGLWDFAVDKAALLTSPAAVKFNKRIIVPYAPETPLSGINDTGFYDAVWYRRTFDAPRLARDQRLILHFGAVDTVASVWVNDQLVATHEGGYTPFSADITDALHGRGKQTIVVRAHDDSQDLAKPRGKQDWLREPHSIWYPRTTGIWQTVWLEVVPGTHINSIRWIPNLQRWEFDLTVGLAGPKRDNLRVRVRLRNKGRLIVEDLYSFSGQEVRRKILLPDPGIDDYRNDLLWWPWAPNIIEAELELQDANGKVIDAVASYTAMRQVAVQRDKFILNARPITLQLVLDQGYWEQSGLTAPDDDALRRDVELVKEMGFNGVRKHQKIEDPRFLYWADRLGLLVWEEMPSPYTFNDKSVRRLTRQWMEAIERDVSHPCIVAWVPFNESWGVPDLPEVKEQRQFVRGVFHLTKSLDDTRPVIGNDGWEMVISDIIAIHDYDGNPQRMIERYARTEANLATLYASERPGHRQLLLDDCPHEDKPVMLTEFGGIAYHKDTKATWGYRRAGSAEQFNQQYTDLLRAVRSIPLFAGFCYTQFTDTYQEANGLLYMDRTPKIPIQDIRRATSE
ncbi:MAG TPA: glycoside hydrolase family 2 TIM barrel-domain containing protein [Tepidisphaeraceae bacterium]|nr:glycoside hydrolase family 2 TIM barrel-domain containing protein [Tepidisphaeraceae bacterium]